MKITNLKEILLKSKKQCLYLDFRYFGSVNECLDYLCNKIKDIPSIVILKTTNISSKIALDLAFKIRQITSLFSSLFLIEDRMDILKLTDADGILITFDSIDISYAKKIIDKEKFFAYFLKSNQNIDVSEFDFLVSSNKEEKNENLICFVLENDYDNK